MHSSRREATQTSPLPWTAVEADGLGRFLRVGSLGVELEIGISVWGICWGAHPGESCKEWGSRTAQGKELGKDMGPAAAQPQPDPRRKHRSSDGFVGSWHTEARGLGCTSEAVIAARGCLLLQPPPPMSPMWDISEHHCSFGLRTILWNKVQLWAPAASSYSTWGMGALPVTWQG